VVQDVGQIATLDVEDDVLEPDAALSFAFFASSQAQYQANRQFRAAAR
jgi:hypothetical protein